MAEVDRGQPVDADADLRGGLLAPGQRQVAPARRTRADEDRVPVLGQQRLHRLDALTRAEVDAEAEDPVDLLVDHLLGQAKTRYLRAHEAAGLLLTVEHRDGVALYREVARQRQRSRPGADAGHLLAVALVARRRHRHHRPHVAALVVGRHALQAADRHRLGLGQVLLLDAAAPAGRLAGAVAGASEDAGEDVAHPVDHVGLVVATLGDETDVLGNRGVRRARPLAVDDLVEIGRVVHVGWLHCASPCVPARDRRQCARGTR